MRDWNFVLRIPCGLLLRPSKGPKAEIFRAPGGQAKGGAARHFLLEDDKRRLKRMHDGQRVSPRHDGSVRVAASVAANHHIAGQRRGLTPVQIPIIRVWSRIKRWHEPAINEDRNKSITQSTPSP